MPLPTELTAWSPTWPQEFEQARSSLLWAAEGRIGTIEHIGATAIPGSPARPMIDLLAIAPTEADLAEVTPYVLGLNYQERPFPYETPDRRARYFVKERGSEVMHTVQLVAAGSAVVAPALRVRDWLSTHTADAQRLVTAKLHALARYGCHPEGYRESKGLFFTHILEQADAAARPD